ncbi:MAG: YCF48-related protein [Syntrophomonadaceae bacterium]
MKKLACFIFALFLFSPFHTENAQNRWHFANPTPTGFDISKIIKDSSGILWAFGEYGTVLKSPDNGKIWSAVDINTTEDLFSAITVNNRIWAVGANGLIIISTDGGESWSRQYSNTSKSLTGIHFVDENNGWIMASDSLLLKTTDGGNNWRQIRFKNMWGGNAIFFIDKDRGFLLCGYYNLGYFSSPSTSGALYRTENGGETWVTVDSGTTKYSSISFSDNKTGYISTFSLGNKSKLLKTTDAGSTWTSMNSPHEWNKMIFKDEKNGAAIHYEQYICILGITTDGGESWENKSNIGLPLATSSFTGFFNDENNIIVTGSGGYITSSTDYGQNWTSLSKSIFPQPLLTLRGVTFKNHETGYVYGEPSILIYTDDAGVNWKYLKTPDSSSIEILKVKDNLMLASWENVLYSSDDNAGSWKEIYRVNPAEEWIRDIQIVSNDSLFFLAGRRLYQSVDGGKNWTKTSEFYVQHLRNFVMVDRNRWILLGHNAITEPCYMTKDAGITWQEMKNRFTTMEFINNKLGYAIDSSFYKTTDGGDRWVEVTDATKKIAYWTSAINFYNENIGWLYGYSSTYFTSDGGRTWVKEFGIKNLDDLSRNSLEVISENEAWAIGGSSRGNIFHFEDSATSVSDSPIDVTPDNYYLNQNYPNPFNPNTIIKYSIPKQSKVELIIYDLLGRKISTLINKEQSTGEYKVQFNGSSLPSGMYIYSIQAGEFRASKKLLLIK